MRIVCIIQARMGSTRLPGKVLKPILGQPMLWHVMERVRRVRRLDELVVATTVQDADDRIADLCMQNGWSCFRGSEDDVLDRYYQAALQCQADVVVRITSDCPLVDPDVIDQVIGAYVTSQPEVDYVSNTLVPRTFPRGLDVEVFSFSALSRAWDEDGNPAWREHVTPYIWRQSDKFRLLPVKADDDYSVMRWTVDTEEDLALVRRIYESMPHSFFGWQGVLRLLKDHPQWLKINSNVQQKVVP